MADGKDGSETDPWGDPQFEQAVRDTAYFLWEHDGKPMGREKDYWFRALERCLRERDADQSLAASLSEQQRDSSGRA